MHLCAQKNELLSEKLHFQSFMWLNCKYGNNEIMNKISKGEREGGSTYMPGQFCGSSIANFVGHLLYSQFCQIFGEHCTNIYEMNLENFG